MKTPKRSRSDRRRDTPHTGRSRRRVPRCRLPAGLRPQLGFSWDRPKCPPAGINVSYWHLAAVLADWSVHPLLNAERTKAAMAAHESGRAASRGEHEFWMTVLILDLA